MGVGENGTKESERVMAGGYDRDVRMQERGTNVCMHYK